MSTRIVKSSKKRKRGISGGPIYFETGFCLRCLQKECVCEQRDRSLKLAAERQRVNLHRSSQMQIPKPKKRKSLTGQTTLFMEDTP
jgi:hypothetical protein